LISNGTTQPVSPVSIYKEVCVGLLFGAILGTAQWIELRRHLKSSYLWILVNSLSYVATSNALFLILLAAMPSPVLAQLPTYLFGLLPISANQNPADFIPLLGLAFLLISFWSGLVIGIPQWWVLRQSLQSVWWWTVAMIVPGAIASIFWVMTILVARFVSSSSMFEVLKNLAIASFAVHSTAYGVIQGVGLCACRRKIERMQS
jgi:hypothetical protein